MKRKTQSIKSLIVISIIILGVGAFIYGQFNEQLEPVEHKTVQDVKQENPVKRIEKQLTDLLDKNQYGVIKKILESDTLSPELKKDAKFILLKEDLDNIIKADDIIKNKKVDSYTSIKEELKLSSSSNEKVKKEATELIKKVEELEKKKSEETTTEVTAVVGEPTTGAVVAEPESAKWINNLPYHPAPDLTNVASLPKSLADYPVQGNIYPEEKRGTLAAYLSGRDYLNADDPHNLVYYLTEIPGYENAVYLDVRSYEYMKEVGIRAYAYYTGSDYLDWKWIATYFVDTKQASYFINPSPRNEDPSELDYDVAPIW